MSSDRPLRRVIAVAPMPPEKSAYALARYSRSPDSIDNSIKWVHGHSSEKFWEQFYFDYGHASIADLGHVIICFEEITELAAIRLEDEPVWDGQAKSSRYQNFSSGAWYVPMRFMGAKPKARISGFCAASERSIGCFTSRWSRFYPSEILVRRRSSRPIISERSTPAPST